MLKKEKRREAGFSSEERDNLKCYFSLLTEGDNVYWFRAGGFSMMPLFWPGCKVRLNTSGRELEVGQVVVFLDGKKLIAHRLVDYDEENGVCRTKGDTLSHFDQPVAADEIIGFVDFIDYFGKHLWVGTDPELAGVSAALGRKYEKKGKRLPYIVRIICYYCSYFPVFTWMQMKRELRSRKMAG